MKLFLRTLRADDAPRKARAAQNDAGPEMAENCDSSLVSMAGMGDVGAFSTLVQRHTPALYRVSHRMLRDPAEAEDVVQECFARLWTAAPNWSPKGAGLVGWLHRVTMNLCLDRLRKPAPFVTDVFPDLADTAPLPDRCIEGREAGITIERALAALPAHYRAALVLSYYEGFPNAVAAEVMDLNVKAMESLLVRARRHLRKLLELEDFTLADVEMLP